MIITKKEYAVLKSWHPGPKASNNSQKIFLDYKQNAMVCCNDFKSMSLRWSGDVEYLGGYVLMNDLIAGMKKAPAKIDGVSMTYYWHFSESEENLMAIMTDLTKVKEFEEYHKDAAIQHTAEIHPIESSDISYIQEIMETYKGEQDCMVCTLSRDITKVLEKAASASGSKDLFEFTAMSESFVKISFDNYCFWEPRWCQA